MQNPYWKHRGDVHKVVRGIGVALCEYTIICDILKSKWVFSERQAKPDNKSRDVVRRQKRKKTATVSVHDIDQTPSLKCRCDRSREKER